MKKYVFVSICALLLTLSLMAAIVPSVAGMNGRFRWFFVTNATSTIPFGVNIPGTIVGTYKAGKSCFGDQSGTEHGFQTNDFGVTINSIDFPGATSTEAGGVNDAGLIVGTYQTGCQGPNNPPGSAVNHGFRLLGSTFTSFDLPATASVSTGAPFGGPVTVPVTLSRIRAVNNNNDIVGAFSQSCIGTNPSGPPNPTCVPKDFGFILKANGTFQALEACGQLAGSFGPGCTPGTTIAHGLNDADTVVGHFQDVNPGGPNGDNIHHGFIYNGGPFTPLLCNGDRTLNTDANGINDQGIIVGACDVNAFVLLPPYRVQDYRIFNFLPSVCELPGGTRILNTVAQDISNDNKIVGSVTCDEGLGNANPIFGFEINLSDIDRLAAPGQAAVLGVSIVPNPVTGGNSATGTVTLTAPAGASGVLVTISSNNGSATVPLTLTIPAGQTTGTFTISTTSVNSQTTATIGVTSSNTVMTPLVINPGTGPGQGTVTGVSIVPNPVTGGNSATGTVTLGAPAGPNGVLVTLASDNGAAGTPTSITIPAGQSSGTFPVTTTAVNSQTTATISATSSNTAMTPLTINPSGGGSGPGQGIVSAVTVVPNPVTAGNSSTGTVTLASPAGPGGVLVTLSSSNGAASTPPSITIPAGQSSGTFPVTTTTVSSQTTTTITATSTNTAMTPLTINPASGGGPGQGTIMGVSVVPNPVTGGNSGTGTVTLTAPAGPGGVLVMLGSNNGAAGTPTSITIPVGQSSGTFPVTTTPVASQTTATITATSSNTAMTPLTINPAGVVGPGQGTITGVSVVPNPVTGGNSATGTVTLTAPAGPGGVLVTLGSNNGSAATPPSVTIPVGQSSAMFPVTTTTVTSQTTATISATSINTAMTPLTINPAGGGGPGQGTIMGVSVVPNPVTGGNSATGTVTLTAPAGSTGVLVTLGSNNGSAATPPSITIPVGQSSGTFPVTTTPVASQTTATISATSTNTAMTPLTINPVSGAGQGTITGVSVVPNPVTGGNSATGTVTLAAPAGPTGVLVTLGSDNGAAGTPPSVTIPAGQSSGTFPVTTTTVASQTTANISATSSNTATTPLTINPAGGGGPGQGTITGVSVVPNPVTGGNSATGTVTLAAPAGPTGVLVTLGSDNGAAATPPSITIPVGQSSGTFPVTTTPVASQTTANIVAASSNTAMTPLTINPAGGGGPGLGTITGVSVVPNPVTGGNSATGTVTLATPAGPTGVLVTLGSNNGAAGTPTSITIPAGQSSGTFPVTTTPVASQTTATISATSSNTATTPLTINPAGGGGPGLGTITGLSVVPNPVAGGSSATGTVTLATPAGANGVLVTLGSDNGAATTPPSITIPSGQSSGMFPVSTTAVTSQTTATISATSTNTAMAPLTINPPAAAPCVQALTLNVNAVPGGSTATGTVTLTGQAPAGGTPVQLAYAGTGVSGPPSILVPAGQNTATFMVGTSTVASLVNAVVTAITGPCPGVNANLMVTPPVPVLTGVSVSPTTIGLGGSAVGTATLSGTSATDTVVNLSSTLPLTQLGIPATVTIPAGATSATFPVFSVASGLTGLLQPVIGTINATAGGVMTSTGVTLNVL